MLNMMLSDWVSDQELKRMWKALTPRNQSRNPAENYVFLSKSSYQQVLVVLVHTYKS